MAFDVYIDAVKHRFDVSVVVDWLLSQPHASADPAYGEHRVLIATSDAMLHYAIGRRSTSPPGHVGCTIVDVAPTRIGVSARVPNTTTVRFFDWLADRYVIHVMDDCGAPSTLPSMTRPPEDMVDIEGSGG